MNDQIEGLFAELRARELPAVRPPGTEPLRRAATRRRAALSTAAGVAVLALASLVAFVRPDGATTPVATPASLPPQYPVNLLAEAVAEDLRVPVDRAEPGQIFTDTAAGPLESRRELLGGTYEVRMSCFGSGSMAVTVSTGEVGSPPAAQVVTVPCDREADAGNRIRTVSIPVAAPSGDLTVRVAPDVAGPGRAAFGYLPALTVSDRMQWEQETVTALGESPDGTHHMSGGEVVADRSLTGFSDEAVENRLYRVRAICIGAGTVTLQVGRDMEPAHLKETRLRCSAAGARISVTYTPTDSMYTSFEADSDAIGRAVVAIAVETA